MQNEFEDYGCCYGKCENTATHMLYHGEYYYCDQHYVIVGECECCGTPIHESWECAPTMCRACEKEQEAEEEEAEESDSE